MVRLGPVNFADYLYQRFILRHRTIHFNVTGLKSKIKLRNNSSDIPLFADMFIHREYEVPLENPVKTIIDCGANVGLASLYFLSRFPRVRIIAIEPEKNNFDLLTQNLKNYPNVTCINKAIWNKKAFLEIIDQGRGNHAFTVNESASSKNSIEATTIDKIIDGFQLECIDILKVDIEGSEEQLFGTLPEWIGTVRNIFCEIHENLKPGLTKKITTLLSPFYSISKNGEYHIFRCKVE